MTIDTNSVPTQRASVDAAELEGGVKIWLNIQGETSYATMAWRAPSWDALAETIDTTPSSEVAALLSRAETAERERDEALAHVAALMDLVRETALHLERVSDYDAPRLLLRVNAAVSEDAAAARDAALVERGRREGIEEVLKRVRAHVPAIVRRAAELPERTSPDDWPEAMLITEEEMGELLVYELALVRDRAIATPPADAAELLDNYADHLEADRAALAQRVAEAVREACAAKAAARWDEWDYDKPGEYDADLESRQIAADLIEQDVLGLDLGPIVAAAIKMEGE